MNINGSNLFILSNVYKNDRDMQRNFERLSSGKRINSAADDSAGLAMASRLQAKASMYAIANRSMDDGRSMLEVADSAAGQTLNLLHRMRELVVQAGNGTYGTDDITAMQEEITELKTQYNELVSNTEFNKVGLLNQSVNKTINTGESSLTIKLTDLTSGTNANIDLSVDVTVASSTTADLAKIDAALDEIVTVRGGYGATLSALDYRQDTNMALGMVTERAQSRIENADMAKEMSELTQRRILQQTNIQLLHTFNEEKSNVLQLFR